LPKNKKNDLQNGQRGSAEGSSAPKLIAYRIYHRSPMRLVSAPSPRDWMDATPNRFANRCLPLRIANQAGWFILNDHALRATWNGGNKPSDLEIESLDGETSYSPKSHFGSGILTFSLSFLFRTPPGYNLQVRGPANWPKDGAYPLEGIVETDWAIATFTMNWKLTRADLPVTFEAGEPICMIVPQRRGELESFCPEIHELDEEPESASAYMQWAESRRKFNQALTVPGSEAVKSGWQKHYVRGTTPSGGRVEEHQTKLKLQNFGDDEEEA
jgi:Family of unknown function (DUF6065)